MGRPIVRECAAPQHRIKTQESDVDPGELAAAAKGYFWRGPVTGEKQAKDIISWAACANLMFAMLASAIGFVVATRNPGSLMGFNIFAIVVGFPSPFL